MFASIGRDLGQSAAAATPRRSHDRHCVWYERHDARGVRVAAGDKYHWGCGEKQSLFLVPIEVTEETCVWLPELLEY
jgi:hypothetical protein